MSHLQYFAYPGYGEKTRESMHMNQAVRVADFITISGQGGWDCDSGEMRTEIEDEVDQAFGNVEYALKDAGGKGWSQVFRITLYMTEMDEKSMGALKVAMDKWLPDPKPVLTNVGVAALAGPGMHVEVEVWAHDPEAKK